MALRPRTPSIGVSVGTLPLDSLRTAMGAFYSPYRRVFTSYTGPIVRLRRNDNTELDFGVDQNGDLDLAPILAWLGASYEAVIVRLYDQTGNGNHANNASTGTYTFAVHGGSDVLRPVSIFNNNFMAAFDFPASTVFAGCTSGAGICLAVQPNGIGGWGRVGSNNNQVSTPFEYEAYDQFLSPDRGAIGSGSFPRQWGVPFLYYVEHTGTAIRAWKDSGYLGSFAAAFTNNPTWGFFPDNSNGGLNFWEYAFARRPLTTSERQLLEGSMAWAADQQALLPPGHPYAAAAPAGGGTGGITIQKPAISGSDADVADSGGITIGPPALLGVAGADATQETIVVIVSSE